MVRPFFVLCRLLTVCYNKKSAFHSIESEKIRHFMAVLFFFENQFVIVVFLIYHHSLYCVIFATNILVTARCLFNGVSGSLNGG